MRMLSYIALACIAAGMPTASATAKRAETPTFVGRWGGGPADCKTPFTFTALTYTPPGDTRLRIKSIERDGNSYLLSFADGYRVALFEVGRSSMTWHSPISGDTFELRRCK